jgi:hypothetical protein
MAVIRYSDDGRRCLVQEDDGMFRVATQQDQATLPVGPDLTEDDLQRLDAEVPPDGEPV